MEQAEESEDGGRGSRKSLSPSKDDSLADFKSPKLEAAAPIRARIIIDKRQKKTSSKSRTSGKKKKEPVAKEVAQPSIESSFFKAAVNGKREGHTCPLCMKYFADTSAGTSHTKSCATKNKVSTKKLLAAVALQERQANERVAIGLPAGPIVQSKDKTPRRPREAGAKGDPDLQLALALSKSLQENQLEQEFEEAILLATEHRGDGQILGFSSDNEKRKTLTNFGFLTNKPVAVSEAPGRTRRKKHLGPTILQTRSQEARDRLLTDRVAEILMGNEAITQVCQQEATAEVGIVEERQITLSSRLLREIHRTTKRVWDIARMSTKIADFYVEDLAPVIVPADSEKQENLAEERNNVEENAEDKVDVRPAVPEESPLEENDKRTEKMPDLSEERAKIKECTENRLKIPSPNNIHISDRQYRNTLPMDWTNTLNVSSMSDVIVLVKNGHIWAHKLVFYVRCSDILLDCDPNSDTKFSHVKETISWPDVDLSTGLAFLEFVYSGLIEKNTSVFSDNSVAIGVRRLARKYKVKALFDYLRRKQAELEKVSNVSEEIESRKFGLCSPVVIEVHKTPSDVKAVEENLPANAEREDAEEIEGRKSGLCSPIVIEVEGTPSDVETIEESLPANGESENAEEERESTQASPSRDNDEFSSRETSIFMQKTAENTLESQNTDAMSVISITSSRSRVSMSPDLFDETTQEVSVDTAKNSEEIEENPDISDDENSNLNVLADLIAQNDFSSSSEASRQSASSPITQDKISEKSRSLDETSKSSSATQHVETPKSRSNSAIDLGTKIKEKSRSHLFPDKPKSNLSLFIAQIQKMNAKGPLDTYTEDESLAEPPALMRRRNPFKINNITDESIVDSTEKISSKLGGGRAKKRGLSVFDDPIEPINPKKVNPEETTTADDTVNANDEAQAQESYLVDDNFNTDEEDISMYSKYRKNHMHNNSISSYRNILKKLENATMSAEDDDKSENLLSSDEKPIDLTQESDSDVDISHSRISGASPLNTEEIAGDTSDSDSIYSAATAIAHHHNSHELSDAEDSSESEDPSTKFPSGEKTTKKEKTKGDESSEKIQISPESVKSSRNSPRNSNHDLLEGDTEIFARSWKSGTSSPLPNCSASAAGTFSSGRKRKSEEIGLDHESFTKNLDDEETAQLRATKKSSKGRKSPRNSPEYSDLDVFEIDEEMFAHSLRETRVLQKSPSPSHKHSFDYSNNSVSFRRKRIAEEQKAKETNSVKDLDSKNATNSTDYPDIDVDDLITQNLRETIEIRKSLTPPKNRSSESLEKSASSHRKRKSNGERRKTPEIGIDDFVINKSNKSSEATKSLRNSPDYHYEVFEPDDNVFTQSFNLPRRSPCRTLSPLPNCASSKNTDHCSTLKIPSPILITSSPEFDVDAEINFSDHQPHAFISNKENLFANDRRSPLSTRKSYNNLAEVISPTNFDISPQFLRDDFEKPEERTSTSNFERPTSPQPSTSRKSSTNRRESANSAKSPLVRWNSMPASSSKVQIGSKRSRTPTQSSRLVMSQDVTPPVNYDMMDTPELKKELSKYGIKPQPRTRARKLLTHIYNELHPLVAASPEENESSDHIALSDDEEPPAKKIGKPGKRTSEDSDSDQELPLSQGSVTEAANVIPEEMDFADDNLSPDDSEETSTSSIKKAFKALLKEDKEMHNKVLTYEPLPLELLHLMLKSGGLKCRCKDLMDFLDEECITFQVQSQRNNSRTRGKKAARSRKRIASTQKS